MPEEAVHRVAAEIDAQIQAVDRLLVRRAAAAPGRVLEPLENRVAHIVDRHARIGRDRRHVQPVLELLLVLARP